MIITCTYCKYDIGGKGLPSHLKSKHNVDFMQYVVENREQFPLYIDCPICDKICTGTSCSRKCRAKLQTLWQTGRTGWSKGLTKDTHSGLKSMAQKASLRKGNNIWAAMSEETKTRDKIKQDFAIKNGYKILRFWESDINKNTEQIFEQILEEIKK